MRFSRPTRRGFTLIEIMVAIFVFSIVMAAIYSTWAAIMKATQVAHDVAAQAQRQRVTLHTIEDSLMGIQSFQASPQYYSFIVENGSSPELSFTAQLPEVFPRNGKFLNPNTGRDFTLRRLTFTLQSDKNGSKDLVLRQTPVLMDMDDDEKAYPLVLAKNVRKFSVLCWGTNVQTGDLEWSDEWDDTNAIPDMLRVSLVCGGNLAAGRKAPDVVVTRVYSIPSQTMPAAAQNGRGGGPGNPPRLPPPQIKR
jgi:prepilin-type N-terminal cleavage/methylation domain-containing protein